ETSRRWRRTDMEAASVPTATVKDRVATKKRKAPKAKTPWWLWLSVAAVVVFCLLPFYWLLNISLKTGPDLSSAALIPPHPTLHNYSSIFQNPGFTRALTNSAIVSLTTTLIGVVVGSFAAYALPR